LPHPVGSRDIGLIGSKLSLLLKMLKICCHKVRFEGCKCTDVRLRPWLRSSSRWRSLRNYDAPTDLFQLFVVLFDEVVKMNALSYTKPI